MSKKRRFYQFTYTNTGEPIFIEDMGNVLKIGGILLEGMGSQVLVIAPNGTDPREGNGTVAGMPIAPLHIIKPSLEEWSEILRQSDDPVYFTEDETGIKHVHRRQRLAISGAVQQRIWARDGYRCLFSGRPMGETQVTVDHWMPLELGGQNNETNYISMARKVNKDKGNQHPEEWCKANGYSYTEVMSYLDGFITAEGLSHLK